MNENDRQQGREEKPLAPPETALKPGDSVVQVPLTIPEQYQIIEKLGEGGIGVVYKVQNIFTKSVQAIKVLKPGANEATLIRFQREAQACTAIDHPNVARVLDFGICEGAPYLVMEYMDGQDLARLLETRESLSEREALPIFRQVCAALARAHKVGIVHRDLKPSNIFLLHTRSGETAAKILDFGIAKLIAADYALTKTGDALGTPLYMSPEQLKGEEVDGRSDLYSLGALMYHCLYGVPPHCGDSVFAIMQKRFSESPPAFPKEGTVSKSVQRIISKCMELDPASRYADAGALHNDLDRVENSGLLTKSFSNFAKTEVAKTKIERTPFKLRPAIVVLFIGALSAVAGVLVYPQVMNHFRIMKVRSEVEHDLQTAKALWTSGQTRSASEEYMEAYRIAQTPDTKTKPEQLNILNQALQALSTQDRVASEGDLPLALKVANLRMKLLRGMGQQYLPDMMHYERQRNHILGLNISCGQSLAPTKPVEAARYFMAAWDTLRPEFIITGDADVSFSDLQNTKSKSEFYAKFDQGIGEMLTLSARFHTVMQQRDDLDRALAASSYFSPLKQGVVHSSDGRYWVRASQSDGDAKTAESDRRKAVASFEKAMQMYRQSGFIAIDDRATCLDSLAQLSLELGDYSACDRWADQLIELAKKSAGKKYARLQGQGYLFKGQVAVQEGRNEDAANAYLSGLEELIDDPLAPDSMKAIQFLQQHAPDRLAKYKSKIDATSSGSR